MLYPGARHGVRDSDQRAHLRQLTWDAIREHLGDRCATAVGGAVSDNVAAPLVRGRFLRRYKRFFADVELDDGSVVVCHCPNTGSMKTLLQEGRNAWIRGNDDPKRKLRWTLVLIAVGDDELALIDTSLPNRLVETAVREQRVAELAGYGELRREVRYGERSRIDLFLDDPEHGRCYVEIKNVDDAVEPHAASRRLPRRGHGTGRRHLHELTRLAEEGTRVVQFYLLGRNDCDEVSLDAAIDPE